MARTAGQGDLVKDLQRQVSHLENDLRARSDELPETAARLHTEYREAREAERTAATYESWRDERVTQGAAAWVLGTVFVRFCEDNGLIEWPFLAGPGERLADAEERHEAYFREHPDHNDRDWLIAAFEHLSAAHPTAAGLFDRRHNPLWEIEPSFEAATALLQFWRRRNDDGEIVHDLTDGSWDTRFLGDLYQDLSEDARKRYALLQTPVFVEEFILDLTLEPAVAEFGLTGLRCIDPACGSGHFLLGMFHRLLAKTRNESPGINSWILIRRVLESIHGCDKNPFAVSIARFRLLVAALHAAGAQRLDQVTEFPINIAVGDSLIHGRGAPGVQGELFEAEEPYTYATEDVNEFVKSFDLLGRGSYHVVVGNPPYITVKDKQENESYRKRYSACSGTYALSVPFAQRLFQLAIHKAGSERDAGFVGQITANSFMKREFGKKLIEEFLPSVHLTYVIDTSGVYIPGHGTPTVILVGRNHMGRQADPIRAVLGVRGEPSQPDEPSKGLVWSAIVEQVGKPDSESEWVSAEDVARGRFAHFPWSLAGGGAAELFLNVERGATRKLDSAAGGIGYIGQTNVDEALFADLGDFLRRGVEPEFVRPVAVGELVRDYRVGDMGAAIFPYREEKAELLPYGGAHRWLWPNRTTMGNRATFAKLTYFDEGRPWFEWHQVAHRRLRDPRFLTYAFVATHNHFVFDRSGQVGNRSAPVIKLPAGVGEDEYLELLGVLNSSTSCFWLKQVCHDKGSQSGTGGFMHDEWERFFEFTGTKLQEFPLPAELPLELGRSLDTLAQQLAAQGPDAVCADATPTRERLDAARAVQERIRGRMIALQEELDWQVYGSYGLLSEAEVARLTAVDRNSVTEVRLGERAFEILLARNVAAGETETVWFDRHGSTPVTEVPAHWPEWYRKLVQQRIETIERRRDIGLIERPECKRRWAVEPWQKREAEALRTWLLDRCERRDVWYGPRDGFEDPRTLTVSQLADAFREDTDMHAVAALYASDHLGKRDLTLAQVLEKIVADQHVPYLAALRYKDTGLRKRAQWEQVWEQQREEDRTGRRLDIPVPPKYTAADFRKTSYWSQRGKLDVPKERFISYPDAGPDADPTLLLGWAGWNHAEQAQALVNVASDRSDEAGWGTEKLTPLLVGLAELLPWVRQWHNEYDDEWGGNPAEDYQAYLDEQRAQHQLSEADLTQWRPAAAKRGRRSSTKGDQ